MVPTRVLTVGLCPELDWTNYEVAVRGSPNILSIRLCRCELAPNLVVNKSTQPINQKRPVSVSGFSAEARASES